MKILVLNCGSSSLKYQLINMETDEVLASGKYERIGEKEAFITHKACGKKVRIDHVAMDHTEAIDFTLKQLTNPFTDINLVFTNTTSKYYMVNSSHCNSIFCNIARNCVSEAIYSNLCSFTFTIRCCFYFSKIWC